MADEMKKGTQTNVLFLHFFRYTIYHESIVDYISYHQRPASVAVFEKSHLSALA
jgi:hypothetical protein